MQIFIKILPVVLAAYTLCGCKAHDREKQFDGVYRPKTDEELAALLEKSETDPDDIGILTSIWNYHTQRGDFTSVISHAAPVYATATEEGNDRKRAFAGSYLAQSYLNTNRFDSMKHYLGAVEDFVRRKNIRFLVAMNSNTKAIHAINVDVDLVSALQNFRTALDIAREIGNATSEGILLCNIAWTYLQRNDTTGLTYARQACASGREHGDSYVTAYGTMLMGKLLHMEGRYDESLEYARELLAIAELPGQERHRLVALLLHGDIYSKKGQTHLAEEYYNRALDNLGNADGGELIETSLSYGNFLLDVGRFGEAKKMFASGLEASDRTKVIDNKHELLLGIYKAYENLGDSGLAQEYYSMYRAHSDSIFTMQNERAFNTQMMHYEQLVHQQQIRDKELQLLRETRKNHIVVFILMVVVVVLGCIWWLFQRKNRMYLRLVIQHQEYLRLEKHLLSSGGRSGNDTENHAEDGSGELFYRIERMMETDQVYRSNDISLDMLAEALDTNRVYVSRAINNHSGRSFYDYINSRRIAEAVNILADQNSDIHLKALSYQLGYNSMSAFYRSFQKETGVPPAKYREEVRKLSSPDS